MSPSFINQMSTLLVQLCVLFIVCSVSTSAWMTSIPRVYNNPWRQRSHHHKYTHSSIASTTQLSYRDDEHDDDDDSIKIKTQNTSSPSRPPLDFQSRMKRATIQNNRRSGVGSNRRGKTASGTTSWRPPNVKIAVSLEDFSNVIEEGRTKNQVVVVRFYATWCKVCR